MKVVFAHDHIFYKYKNEYYSTGGLSKSVLQRYTNVFDEVIVLSRQREIKEFRGNLTKASTEGVKFIQIPDFKSVKSWHLITKAEKIIETHISNCDAVIGRIPSSIGSIAINIARKYNKKYLTELVACPWDSYWNHSLTGKLIAPMEYIKTKKQVRESDFVLYVTNEFLQNRYPTSGKNIACSNVSLQESDTKILEKRLEKISNLDMEDRIIIGTIGAVNVKYKGQQYIIKALAELKKQGVTEFEYHLVGNGDKSYLESLVNKYSLQNQVKFLGTKQHNEIFSWLDTIDIYAQPSKQEGLPRALIEAMSRGLPALGADTAGIPELIDNELIFLKSRRRRTKEIIQILNKISANKLLLNEQATKNFQEASKYKKSILNKKRENFLRRFRSEI